MIKVKNSDLNDTSSKAFVEFLELNLPIALSWKITKLAKKMDDLVILKKETINGFIKKHSLKDENGEVVLAEDENGKSVPNTAKIADPTAYNKEITEFENIENEMDFEPISISLIAESNDNIKPSLFFNLEFMFID